jgi:hypothetical protein
MISILYQLAKSQNDNTSDYLLRQFLLLEIKRIHSLLLL